jgi:hypothetical protein
MPTTTGTWLQQFVEPQLLEEFKNYKDDFIGVLSSPNPSAIDKDGIRFNKLINNVTFHVNKSSEFTPSAMTGEKTLVEWDKMDTSPTSVNDAELRAMAFNKEEAIRVKHSDSFKIGVRDYVLQKLAPTKHVEGKTPIIRTTGDVVDGRRKLRYVDLLNYVTKLERLNLTDKKALFMVLCDLHRGDLMDDKASTTNHRDNLEFDKETGELTRFYKLRLFENNDTPFYDADGKLKSTGAVPIAGDQKGSIFFYAPNTVYHIESVKTLYKPMLTDTRSADPTSEFRLHTYGLCDKKQEHGFGAIISANG